MKSKGRLVTETLLYNGFVSDMKIPHTLTEEQKQVIVKSTITFPDNFLEHFKEDAEYIKLIKNLLDSPDQWFTALIHAPRKQPILVSKSKSSSLFEVNIIANVGEFSSELTKK